MTLRFPQWQGAGQKVPIIEGVQTLEKYYGDAITHSLITESHTMQTSNIINHFSVIHNHTLRCRELVKVQQPETIFTIGGDCGVELIPVSWLNQRYENLGVIWFDAHADANTPHSSPSKNFHGMPLRHLCGQGDQTLVDFCFKPIQPQQIFYLGVRDIDLPEQKWIDDHDIFLSKEGVLDLLLKTLHQQNMTKLYIHFDVDVLDPVDYPYSLLPVQDGLKVKRAMDIIKKLKDEFEVVGTSLTEVTATAVDQLKTIAGILDLLKI